jgi:hypothetical protein
MPSVETMTTDQLTPEQKTASGFMTQRAWTSPRPPDVCLDFWTAAYQAIDD